VISEDQAAGPRVPPHWFRRWRGSSAVLREMRSPVTLLLVLFCLLGGIPTAILLTPGQNVTVAGQQVAVSARVPSLSVSGPAQLVQIGNTNIDLSAVHVYGPLRPKLTLGPIQRNAAAGAALNPATAKHVRVAALDSVRDGFLRWYGWATLVLFGFTLTATAITGYARVLYTLKHQSGTPHRHLTIAEILHHSSRQIRGMIVVAVTSTLLVWTAAGSLAYAGAVQGLQHVHSLSDLVGTYHLSPPALGPKVRGYTGAVIGDSRAARLGGPPAANATDDDRACARSSDSLADEVGNQLGARVLNLACSGASIAQGLLDSQVTGDRVQLPQVGRLKRVEGLKFVVVVIGPNDLYWPDFLRYCYGVENCQDNLTQGEFQYRLAAFDNDYGNLLQDLNDLPGSPQVIIMTSYDIFKPTADCIDTKAPGQPTGLSPINLQLLASRNAELNSVLATGANKYRFELARPRLTPLCEASSDKLGPDIQGLKDHNPFHPTGIGIVRMAASVVRTITEQDSGG
jgi:hypothetical protein